MNLAACEISSLGKPRANANLRAWNGRKPTAGSIVSLKICSGVLAATSSMSMPPAADAMNTGRPLAIEHDAEIEFFIDRQPFFDQQHAHFSALRARLMRDQLHADHLTGQLVRF